MAGEFGGIAGFGHNVGSTCEGDGDAQVILREVWETQELYLDKLVRGRLEDVQGVLITLRSVSLCRYTSWLSGISLIAEMYSNYSGIFAFIATPKSSRFSMGSFTHCATIYGDQG